METVGLEIKEYKGRLEEQLAKAKGSLDLVDNNLKRFTAANSIASRLGPRRSDNFEQAGDKGKHATFDQTNDKWKNSNDFGNDLRNNIKRRRLEKGYEKGEGGVIPLKRKLDAPKVLQCSISGPPMVADYESENETTKKPSVPSYVVAKPIVIPSRKEATSVKLSRETRARDKRMFSALIGTLKKFRQEETQLKEKVDKKAQVEKKLEQAAIQEKERIKEDKIKLIKARKDRELYIQEIQSHLANVKYHEEWEELQKPLFNYIKTDTQPPIYYSPTLSCEGTDEKLKQSQAELKEMIEKERQEIKQEVDKILEKWHIENLETIPDIFLVQQSQPDVNGSCSPPFENIHATVTVKPQKSPPSSEEQFHEKHAVNKNHEEILGLGAVRIKVETPDESDNFDYNVDRKSVRIKQENDFAKIDKTVRTEERNDNISDDDTVDNNEDDTTVTANVDDNDEKQLVDEENDYNRYSNIRDNVDRNDQPLIAKHPTITTNVNKRPNKKKDILNKKKKNAKQSTISDQIRPKRLTKTRTPKNKKISSNKRPRKKRREDDTSDNTSSSSSSGGKNEKKKRKKRRRDKSTSESSDSDDTASDTSTTTGSSSNTTSSSGNSSDGVTSDSSTNSKRSSSSASDNINSSNGSVDNDKMDADNERDADRFTDKNGKIEETSPPIIDEGDE